MMNLRALLMKDGPVDGSEDQPKKDGLATARTQLRPVGSPAEVQDASEADNLGVMETMVSDHGLRRGPMPEGIEFTRTGPGGTGPGTDPPSDAGLKNLVLSRLFPSRGPVKIGRYTILDRLGAGGMGIVYAAYDDRLDRKVAVKVLRPQNKSFDATGRTRLLREAQAMARLSHPNIVTVHESGEHEGEVFLAMEFVRGRGLDRWLREQTRTWREVLDVFVEAGRGLQAAHLAGLIHRDFKPQNVLIGEDGGVKVMDFGLARTSGEEGLEPREPSADGATNRLLDLSLTSTGAVMGTPAYMAPEQHLGAPVTPRTDQFNFCVALYEGLFGQLPFPTDNLAHLVDSVISGRVLAPKAGSGVPQWVHKLVLKGLCVDPEARHPSMGTLLDALARDPAKRRRRALSLGALVGIVAFATYFATSAAGAPEQPCADIGTEISAVWNSQRADTVQQALENTGVHYAKRTGEAIAPKLVGYRDEWIQARTQSCEAHQRGLESSRLYDLRSSCLAQRRAHFETLVGSLEQADSSVVQRAVEATAGLPSLARCEDADALLATIPLPEDKTLAAAVEHSRLDLARARSYENLAKFSEGLEIVESVLEAPHTTNYPALHAEALLAKGSLKLEQAPPAEVAEVLDQAALVALELGHDPVAAEALTKKMYVQGSRTLHGQRALEDEPLIRALVRKTGNPELEALHLNNHALVLTRQNRYVEADNAGQAGLRLKQELYGVEHPQYAYTLVNLGLNRLRAGAHEEAAEYQRRAYALLVQQLGAEHPHSAMVEFNLGLALFHQERFKDALASYKSAISTYSNALGPDALELRDMLVSVGQVALELRDFETARQHLQRARKILEKHNVAAAERARVEHPLATALAALGHKAEAKTLHEGALQARIEALAPGDKGVLDSRFEVGNAAIEWQDWETAQQQFRQVLKDVDPTIHPVSEVLAYHRLNVAFRGMGSLEDAEQAAGQALAQYRARGIADSTVLAFVSHEAGKTALIRNDFPRAWKRLMTAHSFFGERWASDDPRRVLLNYDRLRAAVGNQMEDAVIEQLEADVRAGLGLLDDQDSHYRSEYREITSWLTKPRN